MDRGRASQRERTSPQSLSAAAGRLLPRPARTAASGSSLARVYIKNRSLKNVKNRSPCLFQTARLRPRRLVAVPASARGGGGNLFASKGEGGVAPSAGG